MKYNRQKEMLSFIREKKTVKNEELLEKFNVSIQTLRRDINKLEEQGSVTKVYGGVVFSEKRESVSSVSSVKERSSANNEEKEYVGRLAAAMVQDGDVIFIDSGTTAYRMLHYMQRLRNVTVISHSIDVLQEIRGMNNIVGIGVGGVIDHNTGSFLMDTSLYNYNCNKAFISTVGISVSRHLTNTVLNEGAIKAAVMSHSAVNYIVADHSKFDVIAYNRFADFSKIDGIITDKCPDEKFVSFLENNNIKLIY
ncbi:MAG: DeoR/GlpR transcriptional regulator [Erysipelotrichaceae bacterium]|nr:DeoR/GlpR transcriptional regulator [Erysipelotrichaceae bacterium]